MPLPKRFVVVKKHYCHENLYSVGYFKRGKNLKNQYIWIPLSIVYTFPHLRIARQEGKDLAERLKIGYIENVRSGWLFTSRHRKDMILYDR